MLAAAQTDESDTQTGCSSTVLSRTVNLFECAVDQEESPALDHSDFVFVRRSFLASLYQALAVRRRWLHSIF